MTLIICSPWYNVAQILKHFPPMSIPNTKVYRLETRLQCIPDTGNVVWRSRAKILAQYLKSHTLYL